MSEQGRRVAFGLVAVCVAAAVAAMMALGAGDREETEGSSTSSTGTSTITSPVPIAEAVIVGGDAEVDTAAQGAGPPAAPGAEDRAHAGRRASGAEDARPGSERARAAGALVREAEARARAFASALLRVEAGDAAPAARQRLESLASAPVARMVLDGEPRVPSATRAPRSGTLQSVSGEVVGRAIVAVVVTVTYDGEPSGIALTLERVRSGWLVSDLG